MWKDDDGYAQYSRFFFPDLIGFQVRAVPNRPTVHGAVAVWVVCQQYRQRWHPWFAISHSTTGEWNIENMCVHLPTMLSDDWFIVPFFWSCGSLKSLDDLSNPNSMHNFPGAWIVLFFVHLSSHDDDMDEYFHVFGQTILIFYSLHGFFCFFLCTHCLCLIYRVNHLCVQPSSHLTRQRHAQWPHHPRTTPDPPQLFRHGAR